MTGMHRYYYGLSILGVLQFFTHTSMGIKRDGTGFPDPSLCTWINVQGILCCFEKTV
jgi:hypothetical protein